MNEIAATALPSLIRWPRDETVHDGVPWEIWWIAATLDAGSRRLAVHLLILRLADGSLHAFAALTDIDQDREISRTAHFAPGEIPLPADGLKIALGWCDLEALPAGGYRLHLDLGEGAAADLDLAQRTPILHNGGAGQFTFLGVTTTQYSLGGLAASGRICLDGGWMPATGRAWYDRQWDVEVRHGPAAFTWFGIVLDNDHVLGVFDTRDPSGEGHRWVTIVEPDGTHIVAAADPVALDVEPSGIGRPVPRRWTLAIPARQARLELVQHRIADHPIMYTGLLDVGGSYAGADVTGYGFCDVVGSMPRERQ